MDFCKCAGLEFLHIHVLAAAKLDRFKAARFEIFKQQILIVVFRFDSYHRFHAFAALHGVAIIQWHAFGNETLQ